MVGSIMVKVIRVKDDCEMSVTEEIFKKYPNRFTLLTEKDKQTYKKDTAPKKVKSRAKKSTVATKA